MKISIKTLRNEVWAINVEREETILSLKQRLEPLTGDDPVWQKIIFSGRILQNEITIGATGATENDFFVLMCRKAVGG